LWKAPAIATPYREKLSIEERVAGLSLYWAEARQNFVYFDNAPDLHWDRVYVSYLSKVMGAESKKVLITSLPSPTVGARLHVGEEIVAIDDVPVEQYAEERVAPFVSASTPQDRAVRVELSQHLTDSSSVKSSTF
jgi:hypothetical protein